MWLVRHVNQTNQRSWFVSQFAKLIKSRHNFQLRQLRPDTPDPEPLRNQTPDQKSEIQIGFGKVIFGLMCVRLFWRMAMGNMIRLESRVCWAQACHKKLIKSYLLPTSLVTSISWSQSSQIWSCNLLLSFFVTGLLDLPVSEPNPESFRSISTDVVHLSLSLWITIVELPLELELNAKIRFSRF